MRACMPRPITPTLPSQHHTIRNHNTRQVARMAAALQATHRWMVSGTPIEASVDDVHGELQFLGIQPFGACRWLMDRSG